MVITNATQAPTARRSSAPPAAPAPDPAQDRLDWGQALALPAYTYGTLSGVLSGLTGYAATHPAGGFTINPGQGIIQNPEWTRRLAEGSLLHSLQPILAGLTAGLHGLRGGAELLNGRYLAGALDLGIGVACAASIASPGVGGIATLGLVTARALVDVHARSTAGQ